MERVHVRLVADAVNTREQLADVCVCGLLSMEVLNSKRTLLFVWGGRLLLRLMANGDRWKPGSRM